MFPPTFSLFHLLILLHCNFTCGELKVGRSLERDCPSSLPGVTNAPGYCLLYGSVLTYFRITCLFESIGFYFVFPLICGDGIIGTSAAYCNMGNGIIISKAINIFQQKNKKSRLRHLGQINGKHPRLCSVGYVQNHTRGIYLPRVLPYRELL